MYREIKFRAYCGETVGMEYNVVAGKFGAFYARVDTEDSACLNPTSIYPESVPIMQYTGLIDKKGKEIYEGDIVEIVKDIQTGDGIIGVVEYSKDLALFELKINLGENGTATVFSRQDKKGRNVNRKVIGNIHDNPELISTGSIAV